MKHKYFFNVLLFLLLVQSIFGQENNFIKTDSTIVWSADRQLDWSDFKDIVSVEDPFGNAMTSYKIEVIPETVLVDENDFIQNIDDLTVVAQFYKYHSWVSLKTSDLLIHEQIHFDIAELFSRKLRKRFKELKVSGERRFSIYYSEFKEFTKDCREMQVRYDEETSHGINKPINKNWEELIKKELKNYILYDISEPK